MNEQESPAPTPEEDGSPIFETVFTGECPSLSGRSTLTFALGRSHKDGELSLRIVSNDGGGMFYDGWAEGQRIDAMVKGATGLSSKVFCALHPGRSVNTGGFVMAALKHLGLIRPNPENSRFHEHVPTTTFEQVALAAMGQVGSDPARTRKSLKPKKEVG